MKITFVDRKGKELLSKDFTTSTTMIEVKRSLWAAGAYSIQRQFITSGAGKERVDLKELHKTLGDYGIT